MKKELSVAETKELFTFCRKHYVYQYDLQIELVDHMASEIESIWEIEPEVPFMDALKQTFAKFGIYGFSKIKEEKQKALVRKYNRMLFRYLLDFFSWPKILFTLAATIVCYYLLIFVPEPSWFFLGIAVLSIIFIVVYYGYISPKLLNIETVPGKTFLLLERLKLTKMGGGLIFNLALQSHLVFRHLDSADFSSQRLILFGVSLGVVGFLMISNGILFYIPKQIQKHFREQFPEFVK